MTEVIRFGTFGPIVWDTTDGSTRYATQYDLDHLDVGKDLTREEERGLEYD